MAEKKSHNAAGVEVLQKTIDALTAQLAALTARLEKLEAAGVVPPAAASAPEVEPVAHAPAQAAVQPQVQTQVQTEAQPQVQPVAAQAATASEPAAKVDEFSAELLLAISAAVAAYLGKRPHIRAIRLLGSGAWAQQGRVFVQASHQLNVPHDA
jgi:methylmalonyl-CoA carboxyltransferase large subunit